MIALIDIDGTLADCSHRLHFIGTTPGKRLEVKPDAPVNWDAFHDACVDDPFIGPMCELVIALCEAYTIVYVTGRPHSHAKQTEQWLIDNQLPSGPIFMRTAGDYRPDYVVKREIYEKLILPKLGKADIAIEDRDQVVKMWRELGITTLQCREGEY